MRCLTKKLSVYYLEKINTKILTVSGKWGNIVFYQFKKLKIINRVSIIRPGKNVALVKPVGNVSQIVAVMRYARS